MPDTVVILSLVLLVLVVLLVFFYKKLNKEANNQYTVRNIIYKEGGVRDRVRAAALAVETRLGVQVWPRGHDEEEEMEEIQDEEGAVDSGDSQHQSDGSGTDGEDEQEEDSVDHSGSTKENEGDDSDVEGSEAGEEDRLVDNKPEENEEVGGNSEEKQELKVEGKAEASGGTGLLIDLKQFSGSAIWSEQNEDESQGGDVTAL
uniref:Uncharacterized protein n=1 Tax=Poecilia mexicana TaxID=48701 RepID=A0A3B3YP45_9TELE